MGTSHVEEGHIIARSPSQTNVLLHAFIYRY
jgi:hypothetical protein